MDDIYVYLIDLPTKIHEIISPCLGGYTIYINSKLSQMGMSEAYNHALWHINQNDFEKEDVQLIESAAERHEENGNLHEGFLRSASQRW